MSDKQRSLDDIDNFWDLDSLLPQKRPVMPRRELSTDTVEIEVSAKSNNTDHGAAIPPRDGGLNSPRTTNTASMPSNTNTQSTPPTPISPREEARRLREAPLRMRAAQNEPKPLEPYLIYEPDSSIIKRVAVSKWQTKYNFYEKFSTDAHRLWNRTISECEPVSFFSYIPQYNQLSYAQLKWYIYWRSQVRNGKYPRADYSYILLYVYEILNCPDLIEPARGVELLCDIWLAYRPKFPRIDNYLCEWLCDYCLIYQLPCPTKRLEAISQAVVTVATFKEFYMDTSHTNDGAASILAYSSNYDWRTSRYVSNENIELFSKHISAAFEKVYHELLVNGGSEINAAPAQIVRDAYSGALCVYDMKRCLTVDYTSYTRSPKFKIIVTDIIKYCENRVRMALGIKARLKVENITEEMKRCVDEYFDRELPVKKATKSKPAEVVQQNEYDKLYEPTSTTLSLENALAIEQKSWSTTEILTNSMNDDEYNEAGDIPEPTSVDIAAPQTDISQFITDTRISDTSISGDDEFALLISSLGDAEITALRSLADGDSGGVAKAAAAAAMLADALADKINSAAFDIIGDSIIEPDGAGYRIISDYEGDIIKCLK
ncbi:MAG: hypothetical protein HFE63_00770 [Clostridiales bacterium]|nr:hypothetical protein [Clostridiales bacterium]